MVQPTDGFTGRQNNQIRGEVAVSESEAMLLFLRMFESVMGAGINGGSVFDSLNLALTGSVEGLYLEEGEQFPSDDTPLEVAENMLLSGDRTAPHSILGTLIAMNRNIAQVAAAQSRGDGQKGPISLRLGLARPEDAQALLDCYAIIRDNSRKDRSAEDEEHDQDSGLPNNLMQMMISASIWVCNQGDRLATAEESELRTILSRIGSMQQVIAGQLERLPSDRDGEASP